MLVRHTHTPNKQAAQLVLELDQSAQAMRTACQPAKPNAEQLHIILAAMSVLVLNEALLERNITPCAVNRSVFRVSIAAETVSKVSCKYDLVHAWLLHEPLSLLERQLVVSSSFNSNVLYKREKTTKIVFAIVGIKLPGIR